MIARIALVTAVGLAAAGAPNVQQVITPEQRREAIVACGQDAHIYCRSLKEADGPYAYLACLEQNRTRLTARCVGLLTRYGQ